MSKSMRYLFYVLWAVAFILGSIGVWQRLVYGHQLANYGSYVVWGLWIAGYIYFVGLSAGAYLVAALTNVLDLKPLQSITRLAVLTAAVTMGVALLAVLFDLGHMLRSYRVFTSPNFDSMMTWMIWLYTLYGILLVLTAVALIRRNDTMVRFLFTVGIPLAIAFPGGGGALFATLSARPFWHNPLYPVFFIVGALVSGTALVTALATFWPRRNGQRSEVIYAAGRVLMGLIALELLLEWAEFSVPLWYGVNPERKVLMEILTGQYWWVFWVLHIGLGSLLPLTLLFLKPRSLPAVGMAGALTAVTFLAVRLNIVIPGQITPELKGLMTAYTDPRLTFSYRPSTHEWLVMLFLVAVAVAAYWVGARILPLSEAKEAEAHAAD